MWEGIEEGIGEIEGMIGEVTGEKEEGTEIGEREGMEVWVVEMTGGMVWETGEETEEEGIEEMAGDTGTDGSHRIEVPAKETAKDRDREEVMHICHLYFIFIFYFHFMPPNIIMAFTL